MPHVRTEAIAGITTFFTMAYIVVVNPAILSTPGTGMGLNAFFTFTIILTQKVWWQTALGIVFWAGVLFLLISITPVRETIAKAIPSELRIGTAAGIGLFLTFIGLKNAGFITGDPVTLVKLAVLGKEAQLAILGFVVMLVLMIRRSIFAFLAGIFFVTLLAWLRGMLQIPEHLFSAPDFHTVF